MTKTAFVTGASRGMGLEFCKQLLDRGYRVFAAVRSPEKSTSLGELAEEGNLEVVALDLSSAESIVEAGKELRSKSTQLDVLVNNAGINSKSNKPHSPASSLRLGELEQESLLNQFRVNSIAPVLLVQELLPLLESTESARILNVSSWLGSISIKKTGGNYGYCASKAALNMMAKALAGDLAERGVLSLNFNPGWVQTDMGGSSAKLTVEESVGGMLDVLLSKTLEDTGSFLQWDGSAHPW